MDYISEWIKNIIFIILFTTFLMMFLPESDLRKYVRLIMGFFIISVFLSPFLDIFRGDVDHLYSNIVTRDIQWQGMEDIKREGEKIQDIGDSITGRYYENKISQEISTILKLNYPEWEKNIETELDSDFELSKIRINLREKQIKNDEISEIKIDPVEISSEKSEEKSDRELKNKKFSIKNKISNIFQIPVDLIEVNIEKR